MNHRLPAPAGLPDVVLREAGPADVAALFALSLSLSADSSRQRWSGPAPTTDRLLALTRPDDGTTCVVAHRTDDPDVLLGEARWVGAGPDGPTGRPPELAVAVRDELHGHGIGGALLAALVGLAADRGLERLTAEVLVENFAMLKLLSRYGMVVVSPAVDGVVGVEISTDGEIRGWPAATTGPRVLVEGGSWVGNPRMRHLLDEGADVRQCIGPKPAWGRGCPLLSDGRCRALDEADEVLTVLRPDDPATPEILRRRPARVC